MPVGKNALKRVTNNGYSNVKATAPDMQNSEVAITVEAVVEKEEVAKVESVKAEPKKNTAPKTKKAPVKKTEVKSEQVSRPDGFVRFGLGSDLPEYLL